MSFFLEQKLATQLIESVKQYFSSQGFEEIFVQVERVDAHALQFYHSTNMSTEEDVLHFSYKL